MNDNQLKHETSPYLLQHADNPVDWRPWSAAALAEAQQTGKPILLSVGYAACHWCHVMAHESFEDSDVAAVMNRNFINIKVDREERPDIDQIYMSALHAIGEQGGWPLTMFLTPEGDPIWGGTYFPKEAKYGRPGFIQVLEAVAETFRTDQATITANRDALRQRLERRAGTGPALVPELLDEAVNQLFTILDPVNGGTQGAPKFPNAMLFDMLWRGWCRSGRTEVRDAVLLALRRISQGGIYDHLGGGYARYAVDDRWLVPHFEKMLYDNALLLDLLARVYTATGDRLFADRATETVGFLQREMTTDEGAFASSLDADSEGEEGRFYVWSSEEIADILGEDADAFGSIYGVSPGGNWEGRTILNRLASPQLLDKATESRLADNRARLLRARAARIRPGRDDKVLADWNGLAITALVRASIAFDRPDWLEQAQQTYRSVLHSMERNGRLGHSYRAGRLVFPGLATDHAALSRAALALHAATGDPDFLADAERFLAALDAHHWNEQEGGYFWTADDAEALILRPTSPADEAVPNANGLAVDALVELWMRTGKTSYRDRADAVLKAHSGAMVQNVFATASLFNGFDSRIRPRTVVIVAPEGTDPSDLANAARSTADPAVFVSVLSTTADLASDHPASGKQAQSGKPTAFVCTATECSLPVTDPAALTDKLL
ncbi:thioredoxin domain-containing protein [Amorphus coralli]|uniref:thioredoxin domain-containing protein n=1 Tax=Amorphus coralli TaxID=340680 RepID=UPI000380F1AF|nr:thioredoxin domain-containing protein [Amorphus coralli]